MVRAECSRASSRFVTFTLLLLAARAPAQVVAPEPRPARQEFDCVEPPADGVPVRVVDAAGKPVAGAYVTWFEEKAEMPWDLAPEPELQTLRRTVGKSVRCGDDGTTRVGRFTRVVASSGDRYAAAWRVPRGKPLLLELQPRRSIHVRTLDREGRPVADVPVALRTRDSPRGGGGGWSLRTDATGSAEVGPLDLYVSLESEGRRELWVAVDAPLAAPIQSRFTLAELPTKPIDLAMPPTGRLVIDVVDAQGHPLEAPGSLNVRERWEWEKKEAGDDAGKRWPVVSLFVHDCLAHYEFPHVEIGLRLVVDAAKEQNEEVKQIVDGPAKAGDTVTVRLVVPATPPSKIISGRVLDEHGDPLKATPIEILWNSSSTRQGRRTIASGVTDGDGRIVSHLDRFVGGSYGKEIEPWLEVVVPRSDGSGILASGMGSLPKTDRIGGGDFGEIRLHPSPRFASGIVVDDAGVPVAGAHLSVTSIPLDAEILSGDFTDYLLTATTAADGSFTIWGDAPTARLSINAEPGHVARTVPLSTSSFEALLIPGASDMRLVLWRCATVVVRILGGPDELSGLSYRSSTKRTDGQEVGGWSGGVNDEGTVETNLEIGMGRLEISRGGTVVAVREAIELKPGAVVELDPIDLSAVAHQVVLTIVDEAGKPVAAGWIATTNPEEEERNAKMREMFGPERAAIFPFSHTPNLTTFKDGAATLRSEAPLRPFAIGAAGRTAVVFRHPATSEHVVLRPAPRVALVLDYEGDLVPEPLTFIVSLSAGNDDEEWFRFGPSGMSHEHSLQLPALDGIALARGRQVEVPVRCLGKTRLDVVLGEKRSGGFSGTMVQSDPAVIEVDGTSPDQTFHVKIDRAAIDTIVNKSEDHRNPAPH